MVYATGHVSRTAFHFVDTHVHTQTRWKQAVWPPGSADTVCPRPPLWPFDLETMVCESHLRRGTFLPNLGTLGHWVFELFAMYATDGQTDGRTKATLIAFFPMVGGITTPASYFRCRVWQCPRVVAVSAVVWFTLLVILCWQPRWWALSFEQHFKYVKPGTANLVPRFTAGCCHLANLTLQWAH